MEIVSNFNINLEKPDMRVHKRFFSGTLDSRFLDGGKSVFMTVAKMA